MSRYSDERTPGGGGGGGGYSWMIWVRMFFHTKIRKNGAFFWARREESRDPHMETCTLYVRTLSLGYIVVFPEEM